MHRAQGCRSLLLPFARGPRYPHVRLPHRPAGPLSEQNIKDRYYGVNDPVAAKLLDRAAQWQKLTPPEDRSICTLFVGQLTGARRRGGGGKT